MHSLRHSVRLSYGWFYWHTEKRECKGNHHSVLIARFNLNRGHKLSSEVPLIENRVWMNKVKDSQKTYVCVREKLKSAVHYRWVSVTLGESSALWVSVNKGWHLLSLPIVSCHIRPHCSSNNINKTAFPQPPQHVHTAHTNKCDHLTHTTSNSYFHPLYPMYEER